MALLCGILCISFIMWGARIAPTRAAPIVIQQQIMNTMALTHREDVRVKRNIEVPPPEILRFMRRFGYLEPNPSDSESLYHESAIVEAIKNVQKYGALNQTGKLDNETLELFIKPRCGVPDIEGTPYYLTSSTQRSFASGRRGKRSESETGFALREKRFVIGAPTWKKRRLTYLIANWSLKIPPSHVEREIAHAFALWAQYSGLRFERINDTSADIVIGFGTRYHGDNFAFDGPGNILAHAFYPYEMGSWGGDVHFDEDEHWQENSTDLATGVDFYAVAAHEIGHSLGLAHSPHYNSIMFPYYKGPGAGTTLDYDDTLAMYSIYLTKVLEDDEDIATTTQDTKLMENSTTVQEDTIVEQTTKDRARSFPDDFTTGEHNKNHVFATTQAVEQATDSTTLRTVEVNTPLWTKPRLSGIPNICQGNFNAVSVLNGTVHVFKNEYVYRLTSRYTIMNGYPKSIYQMFPFLPTYVKRVDAAYQRHDGVGVFFAGNKYWVFSYGLGTLPVLIENSPLPIANLIGNISSIDAAMLWPKNNLTYIFSGDKFWRYNDRLQKLDDGYPKSMRRWPGIPNDVDATATLNNGKTYFFKNNLYWLYDNVNVRPVRGYPRRTSSAWLGCAVATKKPLRNHNTTVTFIAPSSLI